MEELLKNISLKDLEKLKVLLSILPINETKEMVTLRVFVEEYSKYIKANRSSAYCSSVECSLKHLTEYISNQHSIQQITVKEVEGFLGYLQRKVKKSRISGSGELASLSRGENYRVYYRTHRIVTGKQIGRAHV